MAGSAVLLDVNAHSSASRERTDQTLGIQRHRTGPDGTVANVPTGQEPMQCAELVEKPLEPAHLHTTPRGDDREVGGVPMVRTDRGPGLLDEQTEERLIVTMLLESGRIRDPGRLI